MDTMRSHCSVVLWWWCLMMAIVCQVYGLRRKVEEQYLSQFPSDVTFQSQSSTPFSGGKQFQFLQVAWLRQTQSGDNRTVFAGYYVPDDSELVVTWLVNGRLVHETDRVFQQEVTKSWFNPRARYVHVASITIPHAIGVTSLQLRLILDTIETLTDVNLQSIQDLEIGNSIMETGTDVALALSSQEDVKFKAGDDVIFLTRFFAEDLTNAVSESLDVRYLRMLPTNPDVTLEIVTPSSNPDVMTAWEPESDEVPSSLRKNFHSVFRRHRMVRLVEDTQNVRGLVEVTASYRTSTLCRLFGGQTVTRRVFVRAQSDRGGYWGRGGPMTFLPFQRSIPVTCGANVDVSVTALGELSPRVYLVKDGSIVENGNSATIFLFRRLLQTEAVFRFENVRPEVSGTYVVWAENGQGRTDETSFTLVLEDDC
ncbi:uncharacterized protein LOC143276124 [Babylonia areolata]|uniref:uncharacterized protein LOC143276124 n=1 Tax=Babylonia areolata TaxID=304850 RepID=UPI003FD4301B